jgi:hypothetical protein
LDRARQRRGLRIRPTFRTGDGRFVQIEKTRATAIALVPITEFGFGHGTYLSNGRLCGPVRDAKPACQMEVFHHLATLCIAAYALSWRHPLSLLGPGTKVAEALEVGRQSQRPDLDPVVVSIEAKLQRAGKGKRFVIENGATIEVNERLNELIKEAFATRNQLLSGSDASIEAMSGRIGMNKGRLTSLIRLSYLACNNGDPGPHHCRPTLCRSW